MTTLSLQERGGRHVGRELGLTALACPVLAYRAIPPSTRRRWSGGSSTSHLALAMLRHPQATFWRAAGKLVLFCIPRVQWTGRFFAWDWDHPG